MARMIPLKNEKVTPDELRKLQGLSEAVTSSEAKAKDALLVHDEAKTELAYEVMQLRRKYKLKAGDSIDDKTGTINRT